MPAPYLKILKLSKKAFRFSLKTIVFLILFVMAYLLFAVICAAIPFSNTKPTLEDCSIYITTNGVHTDIVMPVQHPLFDWNSIVSAKNTISKDTSYEYIAFGWGG
jgi:hypothetical protein